jgi:hypothetical protein
MSGSWWMLSLFKPVLVPELGAVAMGRCGSPNRFDVATMLEPPYRVQRRVHEHRCRVQFS